MTAEEAITRLKAKIDRLGPVNMMAIEQFDELEQRHVFLTTQRRDLVESIAQTSQAIARIDETTKARFTEAFTAIQANFQVTFSTLFGGGRAGLTLLDENDPLESGIDIVASPPGKRLQSVQLLSGGEKALTAIALMFAIFRYKPSPFCLLDEIDAPLDDANVHRFIEMLRGMLDRTQFILITHNRQTMEIANRLYGVTMEEPGVSKLISVSELNVRPESDVRTYSQACCLRTLLVVCLPGRRESPATSRSARTATSRWTSPAEKPATSGRAPTPCPRAVVSRSSTSTA